MGALLQVKGTGRVDPKIVLALLERHQAERYWRGPGAFTSSAGVLPGAFSPDLGEQERTASHQTVAGIPATQQRDRHGPYRWSADWSAADAAMSEESGR